MDETELNNLLGKIGKRIFVQYFQQFRECSDARISNQDMIALLPNEYTFQSRTSRTSKARLIFLEGSEEQALSNIVKSGRVKREVADGASALLAELRRRQGSSGLQRTQKIMEIIKTNDPTTALALVEARIGQGKFGLAVRQLWNHRCSVTGSSTLAALEASHIQSWADSNDAQRLDPNNGLLLTANLHKLFDAGLISFDCSGKMLVSSKLSQSEQEIFGVIGKKLSKKPSAETANYLSYHRTKFLD